MKWSSLLPSLLLLLAAAMPAAEEPATEETYSQQTILGEAEAFFGKGAEGLAKAIEKAFKDYGRPNGYIKGEEAGGAFVVGLRYGNGTLFLKNKGKHSVHWEGPSIGFDVGGSASKVFVLVYHLPKSSTIFQRFPGVEGSLYFVAGVGMNYLQRGEIVLAPIRLGVGWRQGAAVGYMHFTREKTWNPL
jgi:hypothetical protein